MEFNEQHLQRPLPRGKADDREDDFLNKVQDGLKYKSNKLWGEIPETPQFDSALLITNGEGIFKYSESKEYLNAKPENAPEKTEAPNIFDYRNIELDDIRQVILKPKKEYQKLFIDLNDKSIFYEKIHGECFLKRDQPIAIQAKTQNDEVASQSDIHQDDGLSEARVEVGVELQNDRLMVPRNTDKIDPSEVNSVSQASSKHTHPSYMHKKELENLKLKKLESKNSEINHGMSQDNLLNMISNVPRRNKNKIQHSKITKESFYRTYGITVHNHRKFHKKDLVEEFFENNAFLREAVVNRENMEKWSWDVVIIPQEKREENINSKRGSLVALDEMNEFADSHLKFGKMRKLSCRVAPFVLFEYIEENPLILSNIGMCSKLYKYVYTKRILGQLEASSKIEALNAVEKIENFKAQYSLKEEEDAGSTAGALSMSNVNNNSLSIGKTPTQTKTQRDIERLKEKIEKTLGPHGTVFFLKDNEKLPLMGQITDKYIGIMIMENNLFQVPIFKQRLPKTDFLLVRSRDSGDSSFQYSLRKIDHIYIVGQIEPKLEVFPPNGRSLTGFIKKCLKFVIKESFKKEKQIDLRDLQSSFQSINDHNLRKAIKELGGEQDYRDNKIFRFNKQLLDQEYENSNVLDEIDITPEEVCLFEKMHASLSKLKEFGLKELRTADKIKLAKSKYCKRTPDIQSHVVAKLISEELHLTAWNLSQSFLTAKQTQGRLYLTGLGDPTNGNGGYSYVKLPLKTSRYERDDYKKGIEKEKTYPTQDPGNNVTGTDADLRKLNMATVKSILIEQGYNQEQLNNLSRWQKIGLLRDRAKKANENSDLQKYKRQLRVTTKMQKEKYQKDINRLFATLCEKLSNEDWNQVPSEDEPFEVEDTFEDLVRKEMHAPKTNDMKKNSMMEIEDEDED